MIVLSLTGERDLSIIKHNITYLEHDKHLPLNNKLCNLKHSTNYSQSTVSQSSHLLHRCQDLNCHHSVLLI